MIVDRNMRRDPEYAPYCGRCDGLVRMTRLGPCTAYHSCGASHVLEEALPPELELLERTLEAQPKVPVVDYRTLEFRILAIMQSRGYDISKLVGAEIPFIDEIEKSTI